MKLWLSALLLASCVMPLAAQVAALPLLATNVVADTNALVITPTFVSQLLAEARTNSPLLRAANARIEAAQFGVAAVREWDDPQFTLGGTVFGARGMNPAQQGDVIYGLEQKLPFWKRPNLARAVAAADVLTQQAELDYQTELLRREILKTLVSAALAERLLELGDQDYATIEALTAVMEQRVRAGQATGVELLQVMNEKSKSREKLKTDRALVTNERENLNRLLNRAPASPWPRIAFPNLSPPASGTLLMVYKQLQRDPKLVVMRQQRQQSEALVAQSRSAHLPEVRVGVQGRQYSGDAGFREGMFTLSLNLPWGNAEKYRNDVRREAAKVKAAAAEIEDYELMVREETHHILATVNAARREALLYRDEIIPRTEVALSAARTAWDAGTGGFRDVLETHRMLLEGRVMYARAVAEQQQMLASHALHTRSVGFETPEEPGRKSAPPVKPLPPTVPQKNP